MTYDTSRTRAAISQPSILADASTALAVHRVGGKAANLARLTGYELPVPRWFCITTDVFAHLFAQLPSTTAGLLGQLSAADPQSLMAASTELRTAFSQAVLPPSWEAAIYQRFDANFGPEARVAVRSSAVGEDSATNSQAGLMDSYLFVPRGELLPRVRDVLASAFSARCLLYWLRLGHSLQQFRAAVVVQEMVDAHASGVLFTLNPTTGDSRELVIAAGYGLGEGVVGEEVETDTFYLDRGSHAVLRQAIRSKSQRVTYDAQRGALTRIEPVPEQLALMPVLNPHQLAQLAKLGLYIEHCFGQPQDIEWALDPTASLRITQARPITSRRPHGRTRIFDNSNIGESYPGLSSPLTFSFVRTGFELALRKTAAAYGASDAYLRRIQPLSRNALGLIEGRMYYNILNWYRAFVVLPGLSLFRTSWEKASGLAPEDRPAPAELRDIYGVPLQPSRRERWVGYFRLIRNFVRIEADQTLFRQRFADLDQRFRGLDLNVQSPDDLFEFYQEILERLLAEWDVPYTNDLNGFLFAHLLRKLLARWQLDPKGALFNRLLCGESGLMSVEPVRSLLALAATVRQSDDLQQLFAQEPDDAALWRHLQTDPRWADLERSVRDHLARYGRRTMHELKLETESLAERPADFIAMLRSFTVQPVDLEAREAQEREVRRTAEQQVGRALRWHPARRLVLAYVLRQARARIRDRETNRLIRTQVWGMVGQVFRQLGKALVNAGHLDQAADVFYLGTDEIEGFLCGTGITHSLRKLVALRRAEYEGFAQKQPPARIRTLGMVHGKAPTGRTDAPAAPPETATGETVTLTGIGCSPGWARGRARVIIHPTHEVATTGQILVAPSTDPGWVFLMAAASGLVVERGGVLSHSAILGRELGIPTVVGVEGALQHIRDGQELEIHGEEGTVRLLADRSGGG